MTFTDMCSACDTGIEKSSLTIGQALERCLYRAVAAQRVTVGIQECAKLLGCAPERVMLCVIPDMAGSSDVGLHIQHTLVRSFCWENDIRLLTVKNCEKLKDILHVARMAATPPRADSGDSLETLTSPTSASSSSSTVTPPSCLLLEAPTEAELSGDEHFVCDYHDTVIYSDIYPKPVIQLPV